MIAQFYLKFRQDRWLRSDYVAANIFNHTRYDLMSQIGQKIG